MHLVPRAQPLHSPFLLYLLEPPDGWIQHGVIGTPTHAEYGRDAVLVSYDRCKGSCGARIKDSSE